MNDVIYIYMCISGYIVTECDRYTVYYVVYTCTIVNTLVKIMMFGCFQKMFHMRQFGEDMLVIRGVQVDFAQTC